MSNLQIFNNPEFGTVRTVELDGIPWLVGMTDQEFLQIFFRRGPQNG